MTIPLHWLIADVAALRPIDALKNIGISAWLRLSLETVAKNALA